MDLAGMNPKLARQLGYRALLADRRKRHLRLKPIFRLGLYFNLLISWQEVPRNRGNCAQLLATIEQSADRRPRQLTVGAGLIESEKARYFRAIFLYPVARPSLFEKAFRINALH